MTPLRAGSRHLPGAGAGSRHLPPRARLTAALVLLIALVAAPIAISPLARGQDTQQAPDWPDGRYNPFDHSPIRIFVDLSNDTEGYASSVRQAMRYWEEGGNGALDWEVRFEEVPDRASADILFWLRDASRVGPICDEAESALGCARPFERPVPIEVVVRISDGRYRSYQQVREVSQHELGHALGLPHSSDPNDIMGPRASVHAGTTWRPGDLPRLLGGAALLVGVGIVGALILLRALRPKVELGRITRLTEGPCPVARGGVHDLQPATIETAAGEEDWLVCVACRQGRRVDADD